MPWHTVHNHAECPVDKPWAVVKDVDGTVAGCHETEAAADEQLAALYASDSVTDETTASADKLTSVDDGDKPLVAAIKPKTKAPLDDCPEGSRKLPDGSCVSEDEYASLASWHGVLCVEGVTTGDGREFAPDALSWAEQTLLRWQKESAHGGQHDVTVSVGRIDRVWRVGNLIMGEGVIDIESPDGFELRRRMKDGFAGGISIDADDIGDADVEFVWSDSAVESEDDPLMMLFGTPEKMVFHAGRVRAATVVDIPAFVEARIQLGVLPVDEETLVAAAVTASLPPRVVAQHETATSDDKPDTIAFSKRLPNIMPEDKAREAYAWIGELSGGRVAKTQCSFLHHEVDGHGNIGPANLTMCAVAVTALRASRDQYEDDEVKAIYAHLAAHLRDAGQEAPPLDEPESVTAAIPLDDWRPDAAWFADPKLSVPTNITITDQGRVYGHAAQWGQCHIGYTDQCITLPHEDQHPYFMTGETLCSDGSRVAVGQITVGTGHAPLTYRASQAAEHYDNTGAAVADVAVGNDQFGVWVAGAVRASVAASRVHELRASGKVSGDWRRIGGQLRLVGLLAVNIPGFPVPRPRARVASGAPLSLVAAGATVVGHNAAPAPVVTDAELDRIAMKRVMGVLANRVRGTIGA